MELNSRIRLVRDSIATITQILADRDIPVRQQGTQAYVAYSKETGEPVMVHLPYLPDNASEKLIAAVQGFLDHEVGHLLFTDPSVSIAIDDDKQLATMVNVFEDPFVERKMRERFSGSRENLNQLFDFFIDDIVEKNLKELIDRGEENPMAYFGVLLPCMVRAWDGVNVFVRYMEDKWHYVEPILCKVDFDIADRMARVKSTHDNLALSRDFLEKIMKKKEEMPELPSLFDAKSEKSEEQSDEEIDEGSDSGDCVSDSDGADGDTDTDDDSGDDSRPDDVDEGYDGDDEWRSPDGKERKRTDASGEEPELEDGSSAPTDEVEDLSDTGSEHTPEADETEDKDSDQAEDSESADSESADAEPSDSSDPLTADKFDAGSSAKGEIDDIPESDESESTESEPDEDEVWEPSSEEEFLEHSIGDIDDAASKEIAGLVEESYQEGDYLIPTEDFDVIEPAPILKCDRIAVEMGKELDDKTQEVASVLQNDFQAAFVSQQRSVWRGNQYSGRINAAQLSKLRVGDPRVFRKRDIHKTQDYDVTLMIDCSGSMSGSRIYLACQAAYAMAQALDRIGVNYEILGFTTIEAKHCVTRERMHDHLYARVDCLRTLIFKGFDENMSPEVLQRLATWGDVKEYGDLCENIDGESLLIGARRLLAEPSSGKAMIVLSDGNPAGSSLNYHALTEHLKNSTRAIEEAGVKLLAVGIQNEDVRRYYENYVVLHNIRTLPETIIHELQRILLGS